MIVVDVNVVAYLIVAGPQTDLARRCRAAEPDWLAPPLLRCELRNVLLGAVRQGKIPLPVAATTFAEACALVQFCPEPAAEGVFQSAWAARLTSYDAEYVAVARELGLKLLTNDQQVVALCKDVAVDFRTPAAALM